MTEASAGKSYRTQMSTATSEDIYFDYSSFLFTSPKHGIRFTRPNFARNNSNFERPSNFLSKERIKVKIFKNYPPNEPEYGSETGLIDVE